MKHVTPTLKKVLEKVKAALLWLFRNFLIIFLWRNVELNDYHSIKVVYDDLLFWNEWSIVNINLAQPSKSTIEVISYLFWNHSVSQWLLGHSSCHSRNTITEISFMLLGQVKKKTHVSRPRPLHFLAPPLLFLLFFMSNVFMSKNQ